MQPDADTSEPAGARPPERRPPVLRPMTHPQKEYHALIARSLALYIERELPVQVTRASRQVGPTSAVTYSFVVEHDAFARVALELRPYDPDRGSRRAPR